MKDFIVLKTIARLLTPFIIMYAFYVQLHGEYSPGGGFQAGVILAAAYILYGLIFGIGEITSIISHNLLKILACIGVLIYSGTGIVSLLLGGNFLNYSVLGKTTQSGQQIGIMSIEIGVGMTVFAVMLLIFVVFAQRKSG